MKNVTIAAFLTPEEIIRAAEIIRDHRPDEWSSVADVICRELIEPNMERINKALGQESDPKYLAYAVEYAVGRVTK